MACLPDEVWIEALRAGVGAGVLDYRDLCSLSISSRVLRRLSSLSCLWKPLFERDFPLKSTSATAASASARPPPSSDYKAEYRARFEKIKAAKVAAHKRRVLRLQSELAVCENEFNNSEMQMLAEKAKLSKIVKDLKCLEQTRISSVALRIWQPETVRSMQQQVVSQRPIDPHFQQYALEMEARVCKEEIKKYSRRMDQNKRAIERLNRDLEFLTYNPIQYLHEDTPAKRPKKKLKMEKQNS